ncbi:hypothetical protein MNBD_IGNAVI01-2667 [hydrothermal vent metagenome]|uniref:Uncharacterized protein n=1 Tax=hydrothermal vent metagenome TaxID=652676 RepID=A0A3B1BWT0_9ZZZZ
MKDYSANIGGITFGLFSILIFIIYIATTSISGGSREFIVPFIPIANEPGLISFIGSVIIAGIWGYFLGFTFIYIYNFYQRKFDK